MHKRNSYFSNCTLLSSSSSSKRKGCKLFGPVCVCATRAPPSIRSWWNSHTTSTTLSVHCLLAADEQCLRGDWCSGPLFSPAYAVPASTMMSVHFAKKNLSQNFRSPGRGQFDATFFWTKLLTRKRICSIANDSRTALFCNQYLF